MHDQHTRNEDPEHIGAIIRRELARLLDERGIGAACEWLTPDEAAAYAKCTTRTLRARKVPMHKSGRVVRYRRTELDAWLAGST